MNDYRSKHFDSKKEAFEFAKKVRGFVDGPFIDWNLNANYIVFYKEEKK